MKCKSCGTDIDNRGECPWGCNQHLLDCIAPMSEDKEEQEYAKTTVIPESMLDAVGALREALHNNPCLILDGECRDGKDRHYFFSDADLFAAIKVVMPFMPNRDKDRLDALETVSCWIGLDDDGCHVKPKWAAGGVFIHTVREVADSYLPNV